MAAILIVDDLADNRQSLVTLLGRHGHRLVEAADGRQGLAAARAESFDLVITDVLMPEMDGLEFVKQLRLDPETREIPVVFYSATYGEVEARALAGSVGVYDVLTKPAAPVDILKVVGRLLSGNRDDGLPPGANEFAAAFERGHLRLLAEQVAPDSGSRANTELRLRALINIGLDLASERDIDRLIRRVCSAARELFAVSYVTLGVLDRATGTVERVAACGTDATTWATVGDAPPGILGTVVSEQRALRGHNAGGDPASLQLPAAHPEIHAYLVVPLVSDAHVHGWLCLVGDRDRSFTDDDQRLVAALSGQVGRLYEFNHEIAQRKQAESALLAAEERMRFALESAEIGIWDMDYTTGVLKWSDVTERHYGLRPGTFDGTFATYVGRIHPDDRDAVLATLNTARESGADFATANRSIWPDGAVHWLTGAGRILLGEYGQPVRGIGISCDDTQRRTLDEQHRQGQKMETVGRLAGGVAHDFNNLLTVILGYCELLQMGLKAGDPRLGEVEHIHEAGIRAAGLTRQLLAFSRKQILEPRLLDLNMIVTEMQSLLGRLIAEDVAVVLRLKPHLGLVKADRGQVEQVVMNLAVNARDAMPTGGTLTIETAEVELDQHYADTHLGVTPGAYVRLAMTDTGTGMTPEVQARLFEPFFTTKDPGKGTGLGMATVFGIAHRSGGSVGVYSEIGRGTSFKVYFPKCETLEAAASAAPRITGPLVGTETVLIVEDQRELRDLARKLLERQGYTVLVAGNADEAVRIFAAHPSIDILVTDVVMPGASGPEQTRLLVEQRPGLKVIYVSGYTEDAIVQHRVIGPGIAFLNKPFTSETLGRKVREVLERRDPARPALAPEGVP